MKKIILPFLILLSITVKGQTFQWLNIPSVSQDVNISNTPYICTADPSGNIYLTGFKDSPTLWNEVMGNVYFNKYDNEGGLIFSKTFSGKCISYNMISDSEGNIILALGYNETLTIDDTIITSIGDDIKHVLVKLDEDGNLIWYKELYMDGFDLGLVQDFRSIAVDSQNNVYAGYDNYMYSRITKYSATGENLFTIEQQNVNRITSVAVDTEGNIYSAGACADELSKYAGVAVPTEFTYNTYIAKYSPQGEYQWVKYVDDITCPEPRVVVRTPNEIYFSSYLFTSDNFDDIVIEGPGSNFDDIFIAKLNASGNFQWVREATGTGAVQLGYRNYLNLDALGNIYFAGSTRGNVNWGNGISTNTTSFQNDALVLKYNPDGVLLFAKTAGGISEDRMDGVSISATGDIFVTGIGNGNGTFDEIEYPASESTYYPFLAKISSGVLGIDDMQTKKINVYPNPANDIINISGVDYPSKGRIVNTLGQEIKQFELSDFSTIDISDFAPGVYFLAIDGYQTKTTIIKK
jgi:hypothetical protein